MEDALRVRARVRYTGKIQSATSLSVQVLV